MNQNQLAGRDGRFLRRYEYDTHWLVAADMPVDDEQVSVDIVGSTAIVVVDTGDRVNETELGLPGSNATAALNNGVLTIRVDK